jgi:hypothetical protein
MHDTTIVDFKPETAIPTIDHRSLNNWPSSYPISLVAGLEKLSLREFVALPPGDGLAD